MRENRSRCARHSMSKVRFSDGLVERVDLEERVADMTVAVDTIPFELVPSVIG
jgi:hypothetical protein